MVSLIKYGALSGGEKYNTNILEIDGLSTDTKPITTFIEYGVDGREIGRTNIENGSTFTEIDTGKLFMYDAENNTWYEIETSGGGGSGGTDNYNLLTNKPKVNGVELKGNKSLVDLGILFGSSLVAEIDSNTYVVTLTLKDQEGNILGETQSFDLPLESVVVGGRYDNTTKKVILTLQNGNTIEFSVADLVDDLQSELSSTNKLNPEFINYNSTHRAVSDTEKSTWNGKQDALTFDNTPTNGSSNPVKSGGVYAALNNKVDKVNGKGLSTNDFTNADKAQITKNKDGVATVANRGSKNLLPIKTHAVGDATETNGFRFTVQADGGILIEDIGTHSGNGDYYLIGKWGNTEALIDCSDGTYTASLEASDDTVSKVSMRIYKAGGGVIINNVYTNTSANFTGEIAFVFITAYTDAVIPSGGVIIYPMIRPESIKDSTFQQYAPTNRELYETIDSIESELSVPIISSSTLLTDYANTLSRGYHTAFFTSASKPSDAPISDNCFVEIYVYSGSAAIMRVMPTGTAHYANNYVKTKVSGAWQSGWVVFTGTAQSGT